MILLLTNRKDITADFVVTELRRRCVPFFRFNTEDFPQKTMINILFPYKKTNGYISTCKGKMISFDDIKSVWYRRPSPPIIDGGLDKKEEEFCKAECQRTLYGIWYNLDCFWVSKPQSIYYAENKISQLIKAKQVGFEIPKTMISNNPKEIFEFYRVCFSSFYEF